MPGRRVGYVVAIVVNVVFFLLVNVWPTWRVVPFLTDAAQELVVLVNLSLIAGLVVNVLNLALDLAWVKAVGEIITSVIALVVVVRFWIVFPFAFPEPGFDWELLTRVVLGVAMAGTIVSVIVQVVVLARLDGTPPSYHGGMTAPETRDALIDAADLCLSAFERAVDDVPEAERTAPFAGTGRDRDLRDVVNHLHAWHVLLLGWLDADAAGRSPAFPAEGYDWASLDDLNLALRDRYRDVDLEAARRRLRTSHAEVLARLAGIEDASLYDPSRHPWLRGALAEPVHECLGAHYDWAIEAVGAARAPR